LARREVSIAARATLNVALTTDLFRPPSTVAEFWLR